MQLAPQSGPRPPPHGVGGQAAGECLRQGDDAGLPDEDAFEAHGP
jgi:hypothetical protein